MTKDGFKLLTQNQPLEAVKLFEQYTEKNPQISKYWHGLALAHALGKQSESFLKTIDNAKYFCQPFDTFLINLFLDLVKRPLGYQQAEVLAQTLPANHQAKVIATYHAGCSHLLRNKVESAVKLFKQFQNHIVAQKDSFVISNNENLNIMFRHSLLIESPQLVEKIKNEKLSSFTEYNPKINFDKKPFTPKNEVAPVLISCANGAYFQRFGPQFIESVIKFSPNSILHIHIAEPTTKTIEYIQAIRKKHPNSKLNFSQEVDSPFSGSVYFACNRFLLADKFLNLYQTKICIFDIDGELVSGIEKLLIATNHSDFACFTSGKAEPASIYLAGITCFADSALSRQLISLIKKIILLKLKLPIGVSWLLDQAALFSAIEYYKTKDTFKFKNINKNTNLEMTDFFQLHENPEEKLLLMRGNSSSIT